VTSEAPQTYAGLTVIARELGIGQTAARDWLAAFEKVAGPLPRSSDKANAARVLSHEGLEAIRTAREVVQRHPGVITVEEALKGALGLEAAAIPSGAIERADSDRRLTELADQVAGLTALVRAQTELIVGLQEQLSRALPAPRGEESATSAEGVHPSPEGQQDERVKVWQDYMTETAPPPRRPAPKVPRPSWLARLFRR
jgi:hypothetical protein